MSREYLLVTSGPAEGARLTLDGDVLLGRVGDVPRLSDDSGLSRRHARVARGPADAISVTDLGSVNGTYVNGERIAAPQPLRPGDVIAIGSSTFQLCADEYPSRAPAGGGATILHGGERIALEQGGVTIGRAADNALTIADAGVSNHHARIDAGPQGHYVTDLGSRNGIYVNGEHVQGASRWLASGDTLVVGGSSLRYLAGEGTRLGHQQQQQPAGPAQPIAAPAGGRLTIGRDPSNDLALDDVNVSRFHAELVAVPGGYELRDLGSRNGTRVDGQLVSLAPLRIGSEIGIGAFRLLFDGDGFRPRDDRGGLRVDVHEVSMRVGQKVILEPTSISIAPGEFVAVIGESGSGKTTLIKTIAGVTQPTGGVVTLGGDPVATRLPEIGYVPQDEIVHAGLTVREALTYAARLRLPQDTSRVEIEDAVERVLAELGLGQHADTLVRSLSGGQRKRAGVGTEIVGQPGLVVLDEPTSGLDPGLETRLMQLMRELTRSGRAVITVTHATKNVDLCDKVAIMGRGGVLCFFGSPTEALRHFGVEHFDEIYFALENSDAAQWRARWQQSPAYAPPAVQPAPWADGWEGPARRRNPLLPQVPLLAGRAVKIMRRDTRNLAMMLGQVPLLAAGTLALYSNSDILNPRPEDPIQASQAIFVVLTAALWFGCLAAVREIVRERAVLERERAVGVRVGAYLLAKIVVLCTLVVCQTLVLSAIVFSLRPGATSVLMITFVVLTGIVGVAMGLLTSALARNENQTTSMLPVVLLSQLLFAGAIVPVKALGGAAVITVLVFERWSLQGALGAADFEARFVGFPEQPYGRDYLTLSPYVPLAILVGSIIVMFLIVLWRLTRPARQS